MIEAYMRPAFQQYLLNPFARYLQNKQALPINFITLLGGFFGLCAASILILGFPYIAIMFLLLSGYCDCLDGTLARLRHKSTSFGAVLDIVMDRLVEFLILYSLFILDPLQRASLVILMLGSILLCITSFLVVGLFVENHSKKSFHYSPGIMERPEAFVFFIAMILFPSQFKLLAIAFISLVLLTTIQRIYQFYKFDNKSQ